MQEFNSSGDSFSQQESNRTTILCLLDDQQKEGYVSRRSLRSSDRITRAMKIAGAFLGCAFVSLFIPVLHFVLVPLFLILAFIFGVATWLERGLILNGEVICPGCSAKNEFKMESDDWPKQRRCPGCSRLLTFKLVE